ncbi:HIRAN domain-containing protein [Helicobacter trogontum]|uniref:HIRAN domain-containing protein n=1 Tax=Helicobacter trogontum TaxID=50960 RepID=UPI000CF021C4|nr:HIRAN domain-containing protein [Helicobacter trogontum]
MSDIKLIVAWQNPKSREWIPIGNLYYEDECYKFRYIQGIIKAKEVGFIPFTKMNDIKAVYASDEMFPQFANRLLAKSRPEYERYQRWLRLDKNSTPLDELAKNNGVRVTDSIELYVIPKKQDRYIVEFFSHGISHLIPSCQERVKKLEVGEKLYLMQDLQNQYDNNALIMRTKDPVEIVGYVPRIYAPDFSKLLQHNAELKVKQINHDSLMQFQLLCEFSADWTKDFKPFDTESFEVISTL